MRADGHWSRGERAIASIAVGVDAAAGSAALAWNADELLTGTPVDRHEPALIDQHPTEHAIVLEFRKQRSTGD
jgi:hypothetical protein